MYCELLCRSHFGVALSAERYKEVDDGEELGDTQSEINYLLSDHDIAAKGPVLYKRPQSKVVFTPVQREPPGLGAGGVYVSVHIRSADRVTHLSQLNYVTLHLFK